MQSLSMAERAASAQIQTAGAAQEFLSVPASTQDAKGSQSVKEECASMADSSVLDKEDFELIEVRPCLLFTHVAFKLIEVRFCLLFTHIAWLVAVPSQLLICSLGWPCLLSLM